MGRRGASLQDAKPVALLLAAGLVFTGSAAFACGYHNPSDVARGAMNFAYPNSLHVRTAVWQAQASGVLPPRSGRAAKDLFAYQRMAAGLRKLGQHLGPAPVPDVGFTIVLLDSLLWTRYAAAEGGFDVAIHVNGPSKGDAVLVTESDVIRALNGGLIGFEAAEAHGLVRLYGPADRQESVRAVFRHRAADVPGAHARGPVARHEGNVGRVR